MMEQTIDFIELGATVLIAVSFAAVVLMLALDVLTDRRQQRQHQREKETAELRQAVMGVAYELAQSQQETTQAIIRAAHEQSGGISNRR